MRNANIKVWVLTGDKVDTAKNIGFSCRLLVQKNMELLEYPKVVDDLMTETTKLRQKVTVLDIATQRRKRQEEGRIPDYWRVPEHHHARHKQRDLLESRLRITKFSEVALNSDVVLCCRVSPKQKQEIVAMVKKCVG